MRAPYRFKSIADLKARTHMNTSKANLTTARIVGGGFLFMGGLITNE